MYESYDYQYKHLMREIENLRKEVTRTREERDKVWEECREAVILNREFKRLLTVFLKEEE